MHKGFEYARTQNPTRLALERNLAAIEGGKAGVRLRLRAWPRSARSPRCSRPAITSSCPTTPTAARSGCSTRCCSRYQLSFSYVDTSDLDAVERGDHAGDADAVRRDADQPGHAAHRPARRGRSRAPPRRCAWSSTTPSRARTSSGRSSSAPTWSTHSTTKYLNGHSDSVGGVVVAVRDDDIEWLRFVQNAEGAILSPFDSWLVLRGTKTLPLRMAAAQRQRPGARRVPRARTRKCGTSTIPGLPSHPQHELAKRQMRGFGGMLAFELGSLEAARRLLNGVRLHALAESLGGVETLISHPATMTHASVPADRRAALGITDGLVRISAGHRGHRRPEGRSRRRRSTRV